MKDHFGFTHSLTSLTHFTSLTHSLHFTHDQLVKESTRTEGLSDPAFALRLLFFFFFFDISQNFEILHFFTQKEHPAPQEMKFRHKKQKIVLPMVILEFGYPSPQLHQTLKPIRDLFCTTVPIYHVMCIPKL